MKIKLTLLSLAVLALLFADAAFALEARRIATALENFIASPQGVRLAEETRILFPRGSRIIGVEKRGTKATIDLSNDALPRKGDEFTLELMMRLLINAASEEDSSLREFEFRFANKTGELKPIEYFFPKENYVYHRAESELSSEPPFITRYVYNGSLTGKKIFLSAGHGWYYSSGTWLTQRPNVNGLIEDMNNARVMNYHILPLLEKTGAETINSRERDMNTEESLIDNRDDGFSIEGEWGDGNSPGGWNAEGAGAPYRVSQVSSAGSKRVVFKADIKKAGWYGVYIWYVAGQNRAADAEHIVKHAQGETSFYVNQQINGSRWNYLGRFYFEPEGENALILTNKSNGPAEKYVIADAVKFGGGYGSVLRGGKPSGKSRWEEACVYWAQFGGAPASVYDSTADADNSDDVTCRPRYSEWWGGGHAYVSVHSNAFNGKASGTETFSHESGLPEGSAKLSSLINAQLIEDIRADWNKDWINRGVKTANFGELRLLSTMPGALTELAFHDALDPLPDNRDLQDPRFRRICARAIVRAVIKYFNESAPFPPDTVPALALLNDEGGLSLKWEEVGGAEGYAIYIGRGGRGFSEPKRAAKPPYKITGLTEGETVYAAVAAYNATGEGYLSRLVGAKVAPKKNTGYKILVVDGFERWDHNVHETVNTMDYSIEHIEAIPEGVAVDGATNTALTKGFTTLENYGAVDYLLGLESTVDKTFSEEERGLLAAYLSQGGAALITGAEIAWHLGNKGDAQEKAFLNDFLKASYKADECGCYEASPKAGGAFDGLSKIVFSDGTQESYDVKYADEITPEGGSETALTYPNGGTAAVAYSGEDYMLIIVGFPFETIIGKEKREAFMKKALEFLIGYDETAVHGDDDDAGDEDAGYDGGEEDIGDQDSGEEDGGEHDSGEDASEDDDSGAIEDAGDDSGKGDVIEEEAGLSDAITDDDDDNDDDSAQEDGGVEDTGAVTDASMPELPDEDYLETKDGGIPPAKPDRHTIDKEDGGCGCRVR